MQFDLGRFLTAMLAAFLECRDDGVAEDTPPKMIDRQPVAVRMAARRELRRQAKKQGANRRERKRFIGTHIDNAVEALRDEVQRNFRD